MKKELTAFEAYTAMYEFLGELYDTVLNDTLGAALESMRIKRDTNLPVNPAMMKDWLEITGEKDMENGAFSADAAYALMAEFLRKLSSKIGVTGLKEVISYISLNEHNKAVRSSWEEAIGLALEKYDEQ